MKTGNNSSLAVALLVPLLFAVGLVSVLFRTASPPVAPQERPPLPTPVTLDRLMPMPSQPEVPKNQPAVRGDGLRVW